MVFFLKEDMANNKKNEVKEEDIEVQEELDMESFSVIKRLYNETFKDLVDR